MEFVSDHDEFRIGRMGQLYQHDTCSGACSPVFSGFRKLVTLILNNDGKLTVRLTTDGPQTTRYLIGLTARAPASLAISNSTSITNGLSASKVSLLALSSMDHRVFLFPRSQLAPGYIAWIARW